MNDEKLKRANELQKEIHELKIHLGIIGGNGTMDLSEKYKVGEGYNKPSIEISDSHTNTKMALKIEFMPISLCSIIRSYLGNVQQKISALESEFKHI